MKRIIFLSFAFVFASRVLFLSISPAFFDSLEYLRLFENSNFLDSLKQVHYPIHPAFLLITWLFNKIPFLSTLFKAEFLNSFFGLFSTIILYRIAREFLKPAPALVFTLFSAFTPYFWLSQINVMYEPMLNLFLLLSFYLLIKFSKNNRAILLHSSAIFFTLAFLVSSTSLIYLIVILGYSYSFIKNAKKKLINICLTFGLYILSALILYSLILGIRNIPITTMGQVLTSSNSTMTKIRIEGLMFFARAIRNSLVIYLNYLTIPLGIILLILGLKEFLLSKNKIFIVSWLVTFLLLNTVWHAGMFGRLSLLLTLLPVYSLAKVRSRFLLLILLLFLFIYSLRIVTPYHYQKIPYFLEKEYLENISKLDNPLLVISNYEFPYLQVKFDCLILNAPTTEPDKVKEEIKKALNQNRRVLFTSQAVTSPYFQYDGMQYHILSKRRNHPQTLGQQLISQYQYETVKEWQEFDLKIYEIKVRQ